MACVVLASKIEEAPRRVRDVLNAFHHLEQLRRKQTPEPLLLDHAYMALKNQVIKAERRVLKELGFCVHVKHPHKVSHSLIGVRCCLSPLKSRSSRWWFSLSAWAIFLIYNCVLSSLNGRRSQKWIECWRTWYITQHLFHRVCKIPLSYQMFRLIFHEYIFPRISSLFCIYLKPRITE